MKETNGHATQLGISWSNAYDAIMPAGQEAFLTDYLKLVPLKVE